MKRRLTARGGRVKYDACETEKYRLSAKRNGRTTAQLVANQFIAASGKQISRKTVARRLRWRITIRTQTCRVCPIDQTAPYCPVLQWCREHLGLNKTGHAYYSQMRVRFSLSSDCRRKIIWLESGTAYRPENMQEKDRYPTCSIMVWAGIVINGRTCLHVVANGTMTGQRYIDEVLLPHVRLSVVLSVINLFLWTTTQHVIEHSLFRDCLNSEGIQRLVWPAHSPDLPH
ncbi:hypothetical protein TNCV_1752911 [Trichonephila clavipes]|nr:hypothetical protein TNCV_1752911 [Trichonephila clavipes]